MQKQSSIKPYTPPKASVLMGTEKHVSFLRDKVQMPPRGSDLLRAINHGFEYNVAANIAKAINVDLRRFAEFVDIKPATLTRRAKSGIFTPMESDRLYQFAEVFDAALELFEGNQDRASHWLNSPARALGGEVPITLLKTSTGANDVMQVLRRLEYGVLM
jgi:putative toxin-antitoxin system antitoxin component (TIGR02293 family)